MRTVDLFAGCGGLSLGFARQGFNVVGAFEFWPVAAACYRANFDHPVSETDLSDVDAAVAEIRAFAPEAIIGGPPCQDFSQAGKRVEAERANLTECFARVVSEIRPRCFAMENVERARHSKAFASARKLFKDAGYGLTEVVLDASRCGAPQKRKRFVCLGIQGVADGFATEIIESRLSKKPTTARDYFGESLPFEYYYRHPRNYNRRAVFSVDEPAPTMRGVNRPVPKGYPGHPNDACSLAERPEIRALTTAERAQFQTFPVDFRWVGSKTDAEQMIGNAVPVKLAEFVAETLRLALEKAENAGKTAE